MTPNPPLQYGNDRNLRARQQLWEHQVPRFDLAAWVLDLASVGPGMRVLDVGCGNGMYLKALRARSVDAIGCDLSIGMLATARTHGTVANMDVCALALRDETFDVVLAPHMLYHVEQRAVAAHELRRVLKPGGTCIVITNGSDHMRVLREIVEAAVRRGTPHWEWRNPSTHAFSLENGAAQLAVAFDHIECIRADKAPPAVLHDADVAAGYVAGVAGIYEPEIDRPWTEVVEEVRDTVSARIAATGAFIVTSSVGAFVCR